MIQSHDCNARRIASRWISSSVDSSEAVRTARRVERRLAVQPARIQREGLGFADDHGALDHVLELAHVSRPRVRLEQLERLRVDAADRLADLAGAAPHEVLREEPDVSGALAQRRHLEREDGESIVEVAAEAALCNCLEEIAVRGRDDTHVGRQRDRAADPFELALLEHAQQEHLRLHGQLADLVEEEGSAGRELEAAAPPLQRPREGASLVAEQLRRDQRLRNRGAVDAHERAVGAARPGVDGARQQLLARSGLAGHEHGGLGRSDLAGTREHRLDRRGRADDSIGSHVESSHRCGTP